MEFSEQKSQLFQLMISQLHSMKMTRIIMDTPM